MPILRSLSIYTAWIMKKTLSWLWEIPTGCFRKEAFPDSAPAITEMKISISGKCRSYEGKLYVGAYDASSFLLPLQEYANDKNASEEWKKLVDAYAAQICESETGTPVGVAECADYLNRADFGFDLYVTEDGIHFDTITTDGFGDKYNHGCRHLPWYFLPAVLLLLCYLHASL